jgi:hypothetical protein
VRTGFLEPCLAAFGLALPLAAQDAPVFRIETHLATVGFHVGRKGFYVEKPMPGRPPSLAWRT